MDGHLVPRTAADAIVIKKSKDSYDHQILLITRKKETFRGKYAFPGGHIDYGEDPKDACIRELREECGIEGSDPELVDVRGKPDRDPRYHMISIFYLVKVPEDCEIIAGDDADTAKWYNLKEVMEQKDSFAFDHHDVLVQLLKTRGEFVKL
jgi:8-oxo-dGTP diphosphatase